MVAVAWKECLIVSVATAALTSLTWYWSTCKDLNCILCQKNSRRKPRRIIFVRHGQSEGNVNPELYRDTHDNAMSMTDLGKLQARASRFIVSPCLRTVQTFEEIMEAWKDAPKDSVSWIEEPRIREQDFGKFQDPEQIRQCKIQRRKFGGFFYRFLNGESPADVFDRVSSFMDILQRMFVRHSAVENFVLVTIRVLLMRYFRYSIGHFERLENFYNAEFGVLENNGKGSFEIKKIIHPKVNPETLEVTRVEATSLRLWEDSCSSHSKYSHLYDKESLYSDM
ncbi:hypothetical protein AC1031_000921 [Aphanomyces cochlioides]|nr:hypothetical protein AC1031_000921 [Aphanomyces cochlioides]